jgi:hypothetical protein
VRSRVYLVGFGMVAVYALFGASMTVLAFAGLAVPYISVFVLTDLFGHPVPGMFRYVVPRPINWVLYWGFVILILRRLVLFARERSFSVPFSFTRAPYVLVSLSLICLILFVLGMAFSIAMRAGSGVPAAMLAIPASLLLTPTVGWVELQSAFMMRKAE